MSKNLFALIKWCGGPIDKKFTPGIPIEWIRDFTYKHFEDNGSSLDQIFVIEWQEDAEKPIGGWPCYVGIVIQVSSRIAELENTVKAFDFFPSQPSKLLAVSLPDVEGSELLEGVDGRQPKRNWTSVGREFGRKKLLMMKKFLPIRNNSDSKMKPKNEDEIQPQLITSEVLLAEMKKIPMLIERLLEELKGVQENHSLKKLSLQQTDTSSPSVSQENQLENGYQDSHFMVTPEDSTVKSYH